MRKILLGLAATVAIASPLALATSAANAATVDATGHGYVAKGDVQRALGYSDATMQSNAADTNFTLKAGTLTDFIYTCVDGTVAHDYSFYGSTQPLTDTAVVNTSANKVTGFTLTGLTGTATPAYDFTRDGTCDAHGGIEVFDYTQTPVNVVQVNGIDL